MAHFDLDKAPSLQKPITFTAKGETYAVVTLTDEVMESVESVVDESSELSASDQLRAQLAMFTAREAEEFQHLNFRDLTAVISFITEQIVDPRGSSTSRRARRK